MEQPLAERMLRAILMQAMRSGAMDPDLVLDAADEVEREGDADAAHALRAVFVEAAAPPDSDWEAEKRRGRFRVVEGDRPPD